MPADVVNLEDTLINDNGTAPEVTPTSQVATPPAQNGTPTPSGDGGPQASFAPALLERAKGAGLKLDGIDNHEKFSEYLLSEYERTRPYAEYGRSALAQPNNQVSQDGKPAGQRVDDAHDREEAFDLDGHFNGLWNAPQLDQQANFAIQNGIVQLGDNGLYEAAPGYEAMALPILNTLNQAHIAQKEQMQNLFKGNFYKNIYEALVPALRHELSQDFTKYSQESVSQYEQEAFIEKFKADNSAILYTPDGTAFTDYGLKFNQAVEKYMAKGMSLNDAIEVAQAIVPKPQADPAQPTQQQPANGKPAAAVDNRPRDEHGRYLPAGTPAPVVKSKQESFMDDARRKAAASSSQQSYSEAGGNLVTDGDPENIWSQAWNKHKGVAA
jgi:hypothetical protein